MLQADIEKILQSQATVRSLYDAGKIDAAIAEYDRVIRPSIHSASPVLRVLSRRIAHSFIWMVDADFVRQAP